MTFYIQNPLNIEHHKQKIPNEKINQKKREDNFRKMQLETMLLHCVCVCNIIEELVVLFNTVGIISRIVNGNEEMKEKGIKAE